MEIDEARRTTFWPELPLVGPEGWQDTCDTLQLWTQIVGKVRLAKSEWVNHSWHSVLYVTTRGLTTSPVPDGMRLFALDFDFLAQELVLTDTTGVRESFPLRAEPVSDFHARVRRLLEYHGITARFLPRPNEVPDPIPFAQDGVHRTFDAESARRFWQALVQSDRVFRKFRSDFLGKVSPIHFFWGSFDLAVTRFSGREAPPHPGGVPGLPDSVVRDAYSHEVSSLGFWPGNAVVPFPAYYSYCYPQPPGYEAACVRPAEAFFNPQLREFLLPYDVVRRSRDPDRTLLEFAQSTYEAAANLGGWDRKALEKRDVPAAPGRAA